MNLYAYTKQEFIDLAPKYKGLMVKFGCTTRDPMDRINEQQGTSDATSPIVVGTWLDTEYKDDAEIHQVLEFSGYKSSKLTGAGTEWFLLSHVYTVEQAANLLSALVDQVATENEEPAKISWHERIWNWWSDIVTSNQMVRGDSKTWQYVRYSKGIRIRK